MRIDEIFENSDESVGKHQDGTKILVRQIANQYDIKSKYGKVSGYTKNDVLVITSSHIFNEADRGKGYGTDLYQAMTTIAFSLGKVMLSDRNVTLSAAAAWRNLSKRGIAVIENFVSKSDIPGGGGASPYGYQPFAALPPGKTDLTYAQAISLVYPEAWRSDFLKNEEKINLGSKRL